MLGIWPTMEGSPAAEPMVGGATFAQQRMRQEPRFVGSPGLSDRTMIRPHYHRNFPEKRLRQRLADQQTSEQESKKFSLISSYRFHARSVNVTGAAQRGRNCGLREAAAAHFARLTRAPAHGLIARMQTVGHDAAAFRTTRWEHGGAYRGAARTDRGTSC